MDIVKSKKNKKQPYPSQGIRLYPALHDLMRAVAVNLGNDTGIGDAYMEAAVCWLREQAESNPVVKAIIAQRVAQDPILRALMSNKSRLLANGA